MVRTLLRHLVDPEGPLGNIHPRLTLGENQGLTWLKAFGLDRTNRCLRDD